jgi:hypothetical protein
MFYFNFNFDNKLKETFQDRIRLDLDPNIQDQNECLEHRR